MAIDIDQTLESLITRPKSMTNGLGETVVERSTDEVLALLDRLEARRATRRRSPFGRVILAIPPGTVGPRSPALLE